MKGKPAKDEGQLEADVKDLKARLEEIDGEVAALERALETVSQRVAGEDLAVRQGRVGAEERRQTAVTEAGKLEVQLRELALVRKGLAVDLGVHEGLLREIREREAGEVRAAQKAEYEAHVEQAKTNADRAVRDAVKAYEAAARRSGEAVDALEHLCASCGTDGIFRAGQLLDTLLAGAQPAALEAKGYTVVREFVRPPYGRLEFRLLPVRVGVPRESET